MNCICGKVTPAILKSLVNFGNIFDTYYPLKHVYRCKLGINRLFKNSRNSFGTNNLYFCRIKKFDMNLPPEVEMHLFNHK